MHNTLIFYQTADCRSPYRI